VFLNVLYIRDQDVTDAPQATLVQQDGKSGLSIADGGKTCAVMFNTIGPVGGTVKITGANGAVCVDKALATDVAPRAALPGE